MKDGWETPESSWRDLVLGFLFGAVLGAITLAAPHGPTVASRPAPVRIPAAAMQVRR